MAHPSTTGAHRDASLRQLGHLSGRTHQFQLGLLAREIGVQESEPLVVLLELRGLEARRLARPSLNCA